MEIEWKIVDEHHQEVFVNQHARGLLWITSAGFSFWHSYPNPAWIFPRQRPWMRLEKSWKQHSGWRNTKIPSRINSSQISGSQINGSVGHKYLRRCRLRHRISHSPDSTNVLA